jgi:hypothetical protein
MAKVVTSLLHISFSRVRRKLSEKNVRQLGSGYQIHDVENKGFQPLAAQPTICAAHTLEVCRIIMYVKTTTDNFLEI